MLAPAVTGRSIQSKSSNRSPAQELALFRSVNRTRFLIRVAAAFIAFGCGESTAPPAPVATVILSPAAAVGLVVGGTDIITAIPKDAGGNNLTDRQISWATSDPTKVTVTVRVVTGVALGIATL